MAKYFIETTEKGKYWVCTWVKMSSGNKLKTIEAICETLDAAERLIECYELEGQEEFDCYELLAEEEPNND